MRALTWAFLWLILAMLATFVVALYGDGYGVALMIIGWFGGVVSLALTQEYMRWRAEAAN